MDREKNEDCHIMKNTKFGRCVLFEPSGIANWASAKLDGWSWVFRFVKNRLKGNVHSVRVPVICVPRTI